MDEIKNPRISSIGLECGDKREIKIVSTDEIKILFGKIFLENENDFVNYLNTVNKVLHANGIRIVKLELGES